MTDCFFLRYDVHNLKVLIKSRHLAHAPEFLSACGSIGVETLKHCVADRTYAMLPKELAEGLKKLEKRIAVEFDPLLVDTMLDQAMYRQIFENLAGKENTAAYRVFSGEGGSVEPDHAAARTRHGQGRGVFRSARAARRQGRASAALRTSFRITNGWCGL